MRIQFGPAIGTGGALYLDGTLLAATRDVLWRAGNHGATGKIFSMQDMDMDIGAGNHTLIGKGREGCCDGLNSVLQRRAGDADWTHFSVRDSLQAVPVLSAALMLAGLMALPLARRARGD